MSLQNRMMLFFFHGSLDLNQIYHPRFPKTHHTITDRPSYFTVGTTDSSFSLSQDFLLTYTLL